MNPSRNLLKIISYLLIFTAFARVSVAGSLDSPQVILSSITDPLITTDSANCIIPFTRADNLIIIHAKIDTTEGDFILDTGAPHLILNITYFRNYPTTSNGEDQGGITGSVSSVLQTNIGRLSFGGVNYSKVEADLANLGHIENNKGIPIYGLLGMQLFKQFEMIIDYERSEIHLHHISKKALPGYKHSMLRDDSKYNTFPVEVIDNKLVAKTTMGGKKLQFIIDTGAESNVLDSRLPNQVLANVVITRRVILTGVGNKKVDALVGDLSNMKLGNMDIGKLPFLVTNLQNMCHSYQSCLDGLLGFDFLSLHKIGFNFVERKMYIWK